MSQRGYTAKESQEKEVHRAVCSFVDGLDPHGLIVKLLTLADEHKGTSTTAREVKCNAHAALEYMAETLKSAPQTQMYAGMTDVVFAANDLFSSRPENYDVPTFPALGNTGERRNSPLRVYAQKANLVYRKHRLTQELAAVNARREKENL